MSLTKQEGKYSEIVTVHQMAILFGPIILQFLLGGVAETGCMFLVTVQCPVGAAFFCRSKTAILWFKIFLLCLILTLCLDYVIFASAIAIASDCESASSATTTSTSSTSTFTFTPMEYLHLFMNITGITCIAFFAVLTMRLKLDMEYKRSNNLLENILPRSISKRLKEGESQIIENFEDVTILFADLHGFTNALAQLELPPGFFIGRFLGDVFSAWDEVCKQYSIDKIKTIGSGFMAVGGIEEDKKKKPRSGNMIAVSMVALGLEMQRELDLINTRYGMEFKVRVGIHSGPVIGGVIGEKKISFDVWGDAVNTASRMETLGLPDCIHISSVTYNKVKNFLHNNPDIDCRCRGEIDIKGKGKMTTYVISRIIESNASYKRLTSLSSLLGHSGGVFSVEE